MKTLKNNNSLPRYLTFILTNGNDAHTLMMSRYLSVDKKDRSCRLSFSFISIKSRMLLMLVYNTIPIHTYFSMIPIVEIK